jgi:hypothetical protein
VYFDSVSAQLVDQIVVPMKTDYGLVRSAIEVAHQVAHEKVRAADRSVYVAFEKEYAFWHLDRRSFKDKRGENISTRRLEGM